MKIFGMALGLAIAYASLWLGFFFLWDAENTWYLIPGIFTAWGAIMLGLTIVDRASKLEDSTPKV